MKNIYSFTILFILSVISISATAQQTFRKTIDFNNEWYILHTNKTSMEQEIRVYSFEETPIVVNGTEYFRLKYYELEQPGVYISDSDRLFRGEYGKIWAIWEGSEEFLLADFTLEVGEMLYRDEQAPFYSQIIADKEMVTHLDGSDRIRMEFCCQIYEMTECDPALSEYNFFFTEGFIDPFELLKSPCHIWDNLQYSNQLLCYFENGEIVYKSNGVDDCLTIVSNRPQNRQISNLTVFPNPADDIIRLNIDNATEMNIQIWSVDGKLLITKTRSDNSVNVQHLQPGYYVIKVISAGQHYISRFVKN